MPYMKLITSLVTSPPVHHTFYICGNMTLDRSPAYYIENGPGTILMHDSNETVDLNCENLIGNDNDFSATLITCACILVSFGAIYVSFTISMK